MLGKNEVVDLCGETSEKVGCRDGTEGLAGFAGLEF